MTDRVIFDTIVFGEPGAFIDIGNRCIERTNVPKIFLQLGVLPDCLCYENNTLIGCWSLEKATEFVTQA